MLKYVRSFCVGALGLCLVSCAQRGGAGDSATEAGDTPMLEDVSSDPHGGDGTSAGGAVLVVRPTDDALYYATAGGIWRRTPDGVENQLVDWLPLSSVTDLGWSTGALWLIYFGGSSVGYLGADGRWDSILNFGCLTFVDGAVYSTTDWGAGLGTYRWDHASRAWMRVGDGGEHCFNADTHSGAAIRGRLLRTANLPGGIGMQLFVSPVDPIDWQVVPEMTPILSTRNGAYVMLTPSMVSPSRIWMLPIPFPPPGAPPLLIYSSSDGLSWQEHPGLESLDPLAVTAVTYEGRELLALGDDRILEEVGGVWIEHSRVGLPTGASGHRLFVWRGQMGLSNSMGLFVWSGTQWEPL